MSDNKFTATEFKKNYANTSFGYSIGWNACWESTCKLVGDTDNNKNWGTRRNNLKINRLQDYLGTDHWREKVEIGLQDWPLCAYCFRTAYTLHHRIYHRVLFREIIGKHVFPVCQHCHDLVHTNGYKPANKTEIDKLLLEHGDVVGKLIPN